MSIRDELKPFKQIPVYEEGFSGNTINQAEKEQQYINDDIKKGSTYTITITDGVAAGILDALWNYIEETGVESWNRPSAGELMADYLYFNNLIEKAKEEKK